MIKLIVYMVIDSIWCCIFSLLGVMKKYLMYFNTSFHVQFVWDWLSSYVSLFLSFSGSHFSLSFIYILLFSSSTVLLVCALGSLIRHSTNSPTLMPWALCMFNANQWNCTQFLSYITLTTIQKFEVSKIIFFKWKSLPCSPRLHLFD